MKATSVVMASFNRLGGVVFIDSFFGIRGKALARQLPLLWLVPWKTLPSKTGSESPMHKFLPFGEESNPPVHTTTL